MNNKNIYSIIGLAVVVIVIVAFYAAGVRTNDQQVEKATVGNTTTATTSKEETPMKRNIFVTQQDNGKTVVLYKGEAFLLNLGDMDWTLSISNPNIISRVKNIMVIRGAQGIYRTDNIGTTTLSAQGRPHCDTGQMCAQYIVNFSTTIVVK